MIDALIAGKLIKDPQLRTGASGKPFCNFLLSVSTGDGENTVVSGIAFSETAEKIARLKKGDALAVVGSLAPSEWIDKSTGETRHGLNCTVQAALSAYDIKKRRSSPEGNGAGNAPQTRQQAPQYRDEPPPFDDDIAF